MLFVVACGVGVAVMDPMAFIGASPLGSGCASRPLADGFARSRPDARAEDVSVNIVRDLAVLAPAACAAAVLAGQRRSSRSTSTTRSQHVRNGWFGDGNKDSEEELSPESKARCEQMAAEVEELQGHVEEKKAAHDRLKTEMSNYRARTRSELSAARGKAAIPIFKELMPIADEFDLAQQNLKLESDGERAIADRFNNLFDKMLGSWKNLGVEKMVSVGEEFDPELHEAVSMIPSGDYAADKVCNELRGGWVLKPVGSDVRQVLRPSLVCVSSGPGPS